MSRTRQQVGSLLAERRGNALVGWALLGVLALVAVSSFLANDLPWAGFVLTMFALCILPPLAFRDAMVMLPWEVVAMAALPVLGRLLATVQLTGDLATYLSVAALALVVAVELQTFTSVRMTVGFAIAFVVVTTMAAAGVWAVTRWASDVWLNTSFLLQSGVDEAAVERAVNLEFVYSMVAGVGAGVVFEAYFRRRARIADRLPEEVRP